MPGFAATLAVRQVLGLLAVACVVGRWGLGQAEAVPAIACWPDPAQEARCCSGEDSSDCWEDGRRPAACCSGAPETAAANAGGGYLPMLAAIGGLLVLCARDAQHWRVRKREDSSLLRLRRLQGLQGEVSAAEAQCVEGEESPEARLGGVSWPTSEADDDACGPDDDEESSSSHQRLLGKDLPAELPARATGPRVLLEVGEAPLLEVLGGLDGTSLGRWECAGRAARYGSVCSLAGLWRLVHVRALGGRPPATLARPPGAAASSGSTGAGGAWKAWWIWRRRALRQPDEELQQAGARLAERLLELPPRSDADETLSLAQAQLSPMKPSAAWMVNLVTMLREDLGVDFSHCSDERFAPLPARWHCHVLVAAEAALADAEAWHADLLRLFASWSVCFSAATGQPRLFASLVRHFPAQDLWEVDVLHCKVPPRTSASWSVIAGEIVEVLLSSRSLASALCGASRLCSLELRGADWTLERAQLATQAELAVMAKELFGSSRVSTAGQDEGRSGPDGTSGESRLQALQWLLAATCPNPFFETSRSLLAATRQLAERV